MDCPNKCFWTIGSIIIDQTDIMTFALRASRMVGPGKKENRSAVNPINLTCTTGFFPLKLWQARI